MGIQSFQPGEENVPNEVMPPSDSTSLPRYESPAEPPTFLQERPPARIISLPLPSYRVRWTYIILGVTAMIYIISAVYSGGLDPSNQVLFDLGAKWDPAIRAGQWWRLIAPIFLHTGLLHIAFNSYALYVLGTVVERRYGPMRYLAIYLISGIAGNVLSFGLSQNLAVGASGAIMGVLGAQVAYFYAQRNVLNGMGRALLQNALFNVLLIFGMGIAISNVDNFAHLGGLITGAVLGYVLCPRYRFDPSDHGTALVITDTSKPATYWPLAAIGFIVVMAVFVFFLRTPELATLFGSSN